MLRRRCKDLRVRRSPWGTNKVTLMLIIIFKFLYFKKSGLWKAYIAKYGPSKSPFVWIFFKIYFKRWFCYPLSILQKVIKVLLDFLWLNIFPLSVFRCYCRFPHHHINTNNSVFIFFINVFQLSLSIWSSLACWPNSEASH